MTEAEAQAMAKKIGARGYFKTSAKNNEGVREVFETAARAALRKKKKMCLEYQRKKRMASRMVVVL